MSQLAFTIVGARAERFAAAPQLTLRVRIDETSGAEIYAIALRAQLMIEPQRRRYAASEADGLVDLFGRPERYGETLRPLLWTHVNAMVSAFAGVTEIELCVPCSYDLDVAAHKYLAALDDGIVPLNVLFSGTVIERGETGLASGFVPWSCEAAYRLPVAMWRDTMDAHFPDSAWIRVSTRTFADVQRFKSAQGCLTMDEAVSRLIDGATARS